MKHKIAIIDIGTHTCEELFALLNPGYQAFYLYLKWLPVFIAKFVLHRMINLVFTSERFKNNVSVSVKEHIHILRFLFRKFHRDNLTLVTVEPNTGLVDRYLKKLRKNFRVFQFPLAVSGHDTEKMCSIKKFLVYEDDLSNSLYEKENRKALPHESFVFSVRFRLLVEELMGTGIICPGDRLILRMNCEGAELGVLQDCETMDLNLECVIGSIADIKKVHGDRAMERGKAILERMNVPFYYFKGSDPSTWPVLIPVFDKICKHSAVKKGWQDNSNEKTIQ